MRVEKEWPMLTAAGASCHYHPCDSPKGCKNLRGLRTLRRYQTLTGSQRGIGNRRVGGVWIPAGASGSDHVVPPVALEHGGSFQALSNKDAPVPSCWPQIIRGQQRDMHGGVFLGGVEMISLPV